MIFRFTSLRRWVLGLVVCFIPALLFAEVLRVEVPVNELTGETEQAAIEQAFIQAIGLINPELEVDDALLEELGDPQAYLSSYYDQEVPDKEDAWIYVVEFEQGLLSQRLPAASVEEVKEAEATESSSGQEVSVNGKLMWLLVRPAHEEAFVLDDTFSDGLRASLVDVILSNDGGWVLPPRTQVAPTGVNAATIEDKNVRQITEVSEQLGFAQVYFGELSEVGVATWIASINKAGSVGEESFGDASSHTEALSVALGAYASSAGVDPGTVGSDYDGSGLLSIAVEGVAGYGDYTRIANFLNRLDTISKWLPKGSGGGVAYFDLELSADTDMFLSSMTAADTAMFESSNLAPGGQFKSVHYSFTLK